MQPHITASVSLEPNARPLSSARRGQRVRLVSIKAGHRLSRRLAELGLTPGVVMQVIHKNGGPLLIAVRGTRLALGRGVADKIQVVPIEVDAPKRDDGR